MNNKGLTGSTLKMIAMAAMLIDHIGAAVLARVIYATGDMAVYDIYIILRKIGRISFPIFCFLLVEGFIHTSDKRKYAVRLGMFALLSEVPFDLAFQSQVIGFEYQNVFFTLLLGLLSMIGCQYIEEKYPIRNMQVIFMELLTVGACMGAAELLKTDYGAVGVGCIILLYMLHSRPFYPLLAGWILYLDNWMAVFGFLLTLFYNGKRGISLKYVFYLFYPVHLLILYMICYFMGIAAIPAV